MQTIKKTKQRIKFYRRYLQSLKLLEKNLVFKNMHAGKRCFVIGNGPSLKNQDLSCLKDEITFAMSGFWKHPIVEKWQPTYYLFADSLFFDGSEPMKLFFRSLNSRITKSTFFVPSDSRGKIESQGLLPLKMTFFALFYKSLSESKINDIDFTKAIPSVQSVSQFAIEAAIYMGCNPIYLLGLDHDWLANRGLENHFYEGKTVDNHPLADGDLGKLRYIDEVQSIVDMWKGYEVLLRVVRRKNNDIFNATAGGFLDVFKRINYESLFQNKR